MPRIAGTEIPDNKPNRIALTYIYGIGPKFAMDICNELSLDPQQRAKELDEDQLAAIAAETGLQYTLETIVSGEAFLTTDKAFIQTIAASVETVTGKRPELSTSGGTSDARFIKDFAPVAEFGMVGATMHQVDEHVALADIETLRKIYREILKNYFNTNGTTQ